MSGNVFQLPMSGWDAQLEAMAEARAIQPGDLDRILTEEAANLPAMDAITTIVDDLTAARQAVWVRRDAEATAAQAIAWAVRLEQQLGEVRLVALQWAAMRGGVLQGAGNTLLDILADDFDAA